MNIDRWLRDQGPLVVRRRHLDDLSALNWAARTGRLRAVLPGVYLVAALADDPHWRLAAIAAWRPEAVICGAAAARLTFWPELRVGAIDVAARSSARPSGYRVRRRVVPPEQIRELAGLRVMSPALSAVDLASSTKADSLDRALRSRRVLLSELWDALDSTPHRVGNVARRRLLLDSRDQPWSAAERLAHRLFRAAGIVGWQTNLEVLVEGMTYFIDIAFRELRLAVEIDGRLHETDPKIFENDRYRQNALVLEGWVVLRFTWSMLVDHPEYVVAQVREAVAAALAVRPR